MKDMKDRFKRIYKRVSINMSQILGLAEKNLRLQLRFKISFLVNIITPIISIIMPLIIFNQLFEYNNQFGPWNEQNFLVFTFTSYNLFLLRKMLTDMSYQVLEEKYWKTFSAIIIAPFHRLNYLAGLLLTNITLISIPFTFFFILCFIYYPVSLLTVFSSLIFFFLIALSLSGIGLIISILAISKENYWRFVLFFMNFVIILSCLLYPYEIFPELVQNIINLNPLYYIFNSIRYLWIEDDIFYTIATHWQDFTVLFSCAIIFPLIGVLVFNWIYKKYGIVGY